MKQLFAGTFVKHVIAVAACVAALVCSVCSAQVRLRMSTTTSTDNSGLLNVLLPPSKRECNCKVDVIQCARMNQHDVDIALLVKFQSLSRSHDEVVVHHVTTIHTGSRSRQTCPTRLKTMSPSSISYALRRFLSTSDTGA